jgi:hypothetical protein
MSSISKHDQRRLDQIHSEYGPRYKGVKEDYFALRRCFGGVWMVRTTYLSGIRRHFRARKIKISKGGLCAPRRSTV